MATKDYSKVGLPSLFFIFCFFFPLRASGVHTAIPTPLLQINPNDLLVNSWATTLNKSMSSGLCREGSHWRNCYELQAVECIQLIDSLTKGCTTRIINTLPPTLTPTVASIAGQQVGFCVGELFYKLAQPHLKTTPECQKKPGS